MNEASRGAGSQDASRDARTASHAPVTCSAIRVEAGTDRGTVCPSDVHLPAVVLDLRDAWTPSLFAPGPDGVAPGFRATYLAIAAEHDASGKPLTDDAHGALGELYGVLPSLAIVRERLADEARHKCHAQIDSAPIKLLERPFGQDHQGVVKANNQTRIFLAAQLERERASRKLPDLAGLAADPRQQPTYDRWHKLDLEHAGLVAAERHLVCEGLLSEAEADGNVTWKVGTAIERYQRRNFLMPNERFDVETREALVTDSRELDFRFALRVLRERIVDATGLIEDGTAGDGPRPILGRMLDPAAMRTARGHEQPLPNAAPDLISIATEAAARELGWTGPAETLAFLDRHRTGVEAAIVLPPPPAYHASHMALSAEVDRGDVWYDDAPVFRTIGRRPNLVLRVDDHGTQRALVRWPTTIGGWADVRTGGGAIVQRWKESDVGPRVWRDLFAAPTWLPPPSTPDRDLVRDKLGGGWELKTSIMGP
ncbi:MAG: Peptidoglycan-binding domain 1 protein, partial [Deltaproteobacteria bacterium]|nr:Peptidoglycan-binding domain 1 protein [Deltaproteobacteria bacterium]